MCPPQAHARQDSCSIIRKNPRTVPGRATKPLNPCEVAGVECPPGGGSALTLTCPHCRTQTSSVRGPCPSCGRAFSADADETLAGTSGGGPDRHRRPGRRDRRRPRGGHGIRVRDGDRRLRRGGRVCGRPLVSAGATGASARRRRSTRSADAGPEFRRSLPHRQTAWPRRHGRRVSSLGYRARRRRRGEGHQAGSRRGPGGGAGARAPLQAGAAPRAAGHAPQRGAHPRPRRDAGHQVHHDAVHPGRGPLDPAQARRQAPRFSAR